jgi:hypothetical protein
MTHCRKQKYDSVEIHVMLIVMYSQRMIPYPPSNTIHGKQSSSSIPSSALVPSLIVLNHHYHHSSMSVLIRKTLYLSLGSSFARQPIHQVSPAYGSRKLGSLAKKPKLLPQ